MSASVPRRPDKILLVETWHTQLYAQPFYDRFRELGVTALRFEEHRYFVGAGLKGKWLKAQNKFRLGPALARLNRDLIEAVKRDKPDTVFFFRGTHVLPETLAQLKKLGVWIIGWNNDDPFSASAPAYVWRHFVRSIPLYERLFAYREHNLAEYQERGCPRVELLRSFYLRERNHPVADVSRSPYRCQVAFIGHWEADGREKLVEALGREPGIDFRLRGTLWDRAANATALEQRFGKIEPVYDDYNLALASADIALVFLSKLNRDTYTRRCFEIPAAGTFMLAEYSNDLGSLFREGVEAEYFRDQEELIAKVRYYLAHPEERAHIAAAGRARLLREGHEAIDRARQVLRALERDQRDR